ncbi:flagellar motor stator protein MotA [Rubellimicrobium thermophilum DSM 16684]|uniref:Flagellar motor stator protein MotA n=1 Tax=Rubellimicrobium thermophilum DSM 16684 TaxID=1123069 RepID=S9QS17_9RHOB|nr:flagellar motor stator protein MotA [Rubellimicrobium thermophilum]EPX84171.1 flagellar motor stator protein MotA [Rubellimicrobium thermophilum DSM 16684]
MIGIIGIVIIFAMVFGGYILAGGKLSIILKALPFEFMMIGGAALGAFVLANDGAGVKHALKDMAKVFKGPKWKPADYRDLLCLLFALIRVSRSNPVALEDHIEKPQESSLFARYPRIRADREAVAMICDTLRAGSMNYDDPHQVEAVLDARVEAQRQHAMHSPHALQSVADALPALGIVAAVLGVIKTMASIDQPPEVLGKMIGGALVGTFLGVFLAYGLVGPIAARLKAVLEEEAQFYGLIRAVLVANLHAHPPAICIEVGRQATPAPRRPSFAEVEEALKAAKEAA